MSIQSKNKPSHVITNCIVGEALGGWEGEVEELRNREGSSTKKTFAQGIKTKTNHSSLYGSELFIEELIQNHIY